MLWIFNTSPPIHSNPFPVSYTQQYKRLVEDIERERRNMVFDAVTLLDDDRVVGGDEAPALAPIGEEQSLSPSSSHHQNNPNSNHPNNPDINGNANNNTQGQENGGAARRVSVDLSAKNGSPEFGSGGASGTNGANATANRLSPGSDMWEQDWSSIGTKT